MKIQQNKQSHRKKITLIVIVVVLLTGGAGYLLWRNQAQNDSSASVQKSTASHEDSKKSTSSGSKETTIAGDKAKLSQDSSQAREEKEKDATPQYEGSSPDTTPALTGVITYSAVAGDKLIIRTNINQSISEGACNLSLTQGAKTVAKTSPIAQNPSSSACQGFDIPTSELGAGKWDISIKLSGDGKTGALTGSTAL